MTAALSPAAFDPRTSDRTLRLGASDATESWLVPRLLRVLAQEAPRMRLVVLPVQFRTVGDQLAARRVDAAVTVADELPSSVRRRTLFVGGFVCLFDPRHARLKLSAAKKGGGTVSEREYFAHEHVVVSYNGDLRGVVEDVLHKTRRVRCSVSSFDNVGPIVDGSALLATVPTLVAAPIRLERPHLRTARLPFVLQPTPMELLWSVADDDDAAGVFLREKIVGIAKAEVAAGAEVTAP